MNHFVPVNQCPFEKTNLVTKRGQAGSYDEYACKKCGVAGRRYGLSDKITLRVMPKCGGQKPADNVQVKQVRILDDINQFGLVAGQVCDVVASPERRFTDSIWVFSAQRNEPVRLLNGEYMAILTTNPG